ncbi:major facilitator superfamily domain-containing protein [Russula ochroleuca]|uniref:Major facilitator superfamily domain-containing protein n=1 Tax=Russula ochroleuca TaxID=152965 RepID=A0A9P5MTU0_9AGAM|nr:major facilitator superfamily domain-containing protein [Russula ochroleuca]
MSLLRLSLTCLSIAANALLAGGIFTFPLLSPVLALHCKLTQPQLTTIALLGMMGQYPFAALVGKVIDGYGPWACSLIASVLFSTGFGLFAAEVAKTPDDIAQPSKSSFRILAACFFLTGLGTASSYFSSIFAASKTFPQYPGAASGASMAFFGLSPLFLSLLASTYFTDPTTGLDVTRFLMFLAIASGIVHVIGAFTLRIPTSQCGVASQPDSVVSGRDEESSIDERQPLLPQKAPRSGGQAVRADEGSVLHLFRDPYFWSLAFIILIITGSCEMIISNIGTIVLSLYPNSVAGIKSLSSSAETVTTTQVRLISISNTLSRLISGPLADIISPLISHKPGDGPSPPRKYRISRVVLLSGTSLLLAGAFVYLELAIKTPGDLWILSVATGVAYGITFTILPSIVSCVWGKEDSGRNFGLITYAPLFGTPLFSYLYAFVSAHNSVGGGVCIGATCWSLTFWVCTGASLLSFVTSILLSQRWKGLV